MTRLLLLAAVSVCAGCATTTVQHAQDLGALGQAYAAAVAKVADEAHASSVSFALDELRKERAGGAFRDARERERALDERVEALKTRQQLVEAAKRELALIAEYFASLERFAKVDNQRAVAIATAGLADNINALGKAVAENRAAAKALITPAEKSAFAKLAGQVSRAMHGAMLGAALERAAETIATQLRVQTRLLGIFSAWITDRQAMELREFYRTHVRRPFAQEGDLRHVWDGAVREYLKGAGVSATLRQAEAAAEKVERFWAGYLAGETTTQGLLADLKDIQAALSALDEFRRAREAER